MHPCMMLSKNIKVNKPKLEKIGLTSIEKILDGFVTKNLLGNPVVHVKFVIMWKQGEIGIIILSRMEIFHSCQLFGCLISMYRNVKRISFGEKERNSKKTEKVD